MIILHQSLSLFMTREIVFIRHAESDLNTAKVRAKLIAGDQPLPNFLKNLSVWDDLESSIGLTKKGIQQATTLANELECPEGVEILSSPLNRARLTALLYVKNHFGSGYFDKVRLEELLLEIPLEIEITKIVAMAKIKQETGVEVLEQWLNYDNDRIQIILEKARLRILNLLTFLNKSGNSTALCFGHRIFMGLFQTLIENNLLQTPISEITDFHTFIINLNNNILKVPNAQPIPYSISEIIKNLKI